MKTAIVILSILDFLMLGSTLICGFWIRANQGANPDPGSLSFHAAIAIASVVLVVITLILALLRR